ncbi:MAG: GNAT family N-acetyltransferase [Acidobacteriota bacterium]
MSARLDLRSLTPEMHELSLAGDRRAFGLRLDAEVPEDWPDAREVVQLRLGQLRDDPALQEWLLRAIVLRETNEMVGHVGFHAPPGAGYLEEWAPGGVELGYTVFEHHRRRGYAREAIEAMMAWARQRAGVSRFVVSVTPANVASRQLADSLGFVKRGECMDPVDGMEEVLVRESDD